MKAFVITLSGHDYSESVAKRCILSARNVGKIEVDRFRAVSRDRAEDAMRSYGLEWTWAKGNTAITYCEKTGLRQHPYGDLLSCIGCAMSHYLLWRECVRLREPLLILEHDAVFIREMPELEFDGICQINDPRGATPRGDWWSDRMAERGPGIFPKTRVLEDPRPDGLAGNSAYLVKPLSAYQLIQKVHEIGLWPNDAIMCRQLFPYLQELWPPVTRVEQGQSTST